MTIKELFDSSGRLEKRIEKVIQYDRIDADLLKDEISEYVVTESMNRSLNNLLDAVDEGMQNGSPEVGVWVSGFYGSGKSSFTKYLGFALDDAHKIEGKPFLDFLKDRITDEAVATRLSVVAKRHNPAVVMLDLASQQLAGASMAEVSTVLYAVVMQWAGYSQDRKISYLELMLENDDRLEDFKAKVSDRLQGMTWEDVKDQPLVANQVASELAPEFYPALYTDSKAFQNQKIDEDLTTDKQARAMVELVRKRSGKENVMFIVDEIGQYVGSRDPLILNLDGLAKNLKSIGNGKVWLLATAQQTLTEDSPQAQINTPKLYKLQARFPVQVDLEAGDIREICYLRLLSKSADGKRRLEKLFDDHGQSLKFHSKLTDTRYFSQELDKEIFVKLYPFLPQHFDILLELLGRLAKSTGGVGLRSAIKVIQDVLVDDGNGVPLMNVDLGTLATTVTFYDALYIDIKRSFSHITMAVDRAVKAFGPESTEAGVAKTVAVLQILEDFPVTEDNVTALVYPSVESPSPASEVSKAVKNLIDEPAVPLVEVDGKLRFMSEAASELERDRRELAPMAADRSRIVNEVIKELFTPVPMANLKGNKRVQCGVKTVTADGRAVSVLGDKDEIQLVVETVGESDYDAVKNDRIADSTHPSNLALIYMVGHEPARLTEMVTEIYRCAEIFNRNRSKTMEKELGDYLEGQRQRSVDLKKDLRVKIQSGLEKGSVVFRGQPTPITTAGTMSDAAKKALENAAEKIYDRYELAPVAAETSTAEKFLNTEKLDRIQSKNDPLSLVKTDGTVDVSHGALTAVNDYLNTAGLIEGRDLLTHFSQAPFLWSKDTTRYLVAALLTAGKVKLRIGGEDITVRGKTAVDGMKTNVTFNRVGVSLRDNQIGPGMLLKAVERLGKLLGEDVAPLEDRVSAVVASRFPDFQRDYGSLGPVLGELGLAGSDRADRVKDDISEILKGDASDAAARLGTDPCGLYDDLRWAAKASKALTNDFKSTVKSALFHIDGVDSLPDSGTAGELRVVTTETRQRLSEFLSHDGVFDHIADIKGLVTLLIEETADAAVTLKREHELRLETDKEKIEKSPEWSIIGGTEQERLAGILDGLRADFSEDLPGIQHYLSTGFGYIEGIKQVNAALKKAAESKEARPDEEPDNISTWTETRFSLPREITTPEELDGLIAGLTALKIKFRDFARIVFLKGGR